MMLVLEYNREIFTIALLANKSFMVYSSSILFHSLKVKPIFINRVVSTNKRYVTGQRLSPVKMKNLYRALKWLYGVRFMLTASLVLIVSRKKWVPLLINVVRKMFPGWWILLLREYPYRPARSSDMTPGDFYLRGYLRAEVFKHFLRILKQLKLYIKE